MSEEVNKKVLEDAMEPLADSIVRPTMAANMANTALVSALVKHLVDKGIIDLEEYLESTHESESKILSGLIDNEGIETNKIAITKTFEDHRGYFTKSE